MPGEPRFGQNLEPIVDKRSVISRLEVSGIAEADEARLCLDRGLGGRQDGAGVGEVMACGRASLRVLTTW